jgi:hypothetical protein
MTDQLEKLHLNRDAFEKMQLLGERFVPKFTQVDPHLECAFIRKNRKFPVGIEMLTTNPDLALLFSGFDNLQYNPTVLLCMGQDLNRNVDYGFCGVGCFQIESTMFHEGGDLRRGTWEPSLPEVQMFGHFMEEMCRVRWGIGQKALACEFGVKPEDIGIRENYVQIGFQATVEVGEDEWMERYAIQQKNLELAQKYHTQQVLSKFSNTGKGTLQ